MDVHCDEIDDEQSRFVETVKAAALALKLEMVAKSPPATQRCTLTGSAYALAACSVC